MGAASPAVTESAARCCKPHTWKESWPVRPYGRSNGHGVQAQVEGRAAAFYAIERGATQRRACALLQIARSSLRYVPVLPLKNAPYCRRCNGCRRSIRVMGHAASGFFLPARAWRWVGNAAPGFGRSMACKCQRSAPGNGSQVAGHGRWRQRSPMQYGVTTLYLMPAPTGSS
jgi:hypothetical protein